jgi:predicted permease
MLLLALAGAAGCVLLIACTNLASLLVARATARTRELAVRRALGAGRLHLIRQFLAETLVLTCAGGAFGVVIGITALPTIVRLVPVVLPISEVPSADLRMLAIAAVLTLVTGVIAGVAPALRASGRADLASLRDGARVGPTRRTERIRAGLIVAQVSVSVVLLVAAGLLLRALWRVQATPTGFDTDRVLTMRTMLPFARYGLQAPRVEFYRQVLTQVAALPGVSAVAYTSYLPFTMRGGIWPVTAPGVAAGPVPERTASARFITPDYFKVMQIPLMIGRAFDDADSLTAVPTAIVSDEFVRRYLDGRTPIGEQFQFGPSGVRTIVGVVGDVRVRGLEQRSEPQVYLPYEQQRDNTTLGYMPKDLVVKVDEREDEAAAMARLATSIRHIVGRVDSRQPISDVRPLIDIVSAETSTRAVQVRVLGAFAGVACVLAAVGLHGLFAFVVSMRAREFGVRLALGAEPRTILALVGRRVAMLAAVGVLTGAGAGYAAGRWMSSLLAGISPGDPITYGVSVTAMLVTALAGGIVPAVRAARTSPTAALASE